MWQTTGDTMVYWFLIELVVTDMCDWNEVLEFKKYSEYRVFISHIKVT